MQLTLPDGGEIPFIPFNEFANTLNEDKIYLYGPSGSGKSRTLYEIMKSKIISCERIFIINPRNIVAGGGAAGDAQLSSSSSSSATVAGRIEIPELISKFTENDAVIWDNFPDDLVKKDIETGMKVLELISSRHVKVLLIALKPKYLESYRDIAANIIELYKHNMRFDKEKIKSIIKAYGTATRFKQIYEKYIAKDLDRISRILWEKEPIPLTVLDYYKELSNKESQKQYYYHFYDQELKEQEQQEHSSSVPAPPSPLPPPSLNAVLEAENLLRSTEYYKHQFEYIKNIDERRSDAEFLFTLRLCYEIGHSRTLSSIQELQTGIFNSTCPKDASRKLSTWVYLSGQYYSMHDAARQSITFDDHAIMQIMAYLSDNFMKIIPKEKSQIYQFGLFFGKHFEYIPRENHYSDNSNTTTSSFLPSHIYDYMKSNRYFENCVGHGIGESFLTLDNELQQIVLDRVGIESLQRALALV